MSSPESLRLSSVSWGEEAGGGDGHDGGISKLCLLCYKALIVKPNQLFFSFSVQEEVSVSQLHDQKRKTPSPWLQQKYAERGLWPIRWVLASLLPEGSGKLQMRTNTVTQRVSFSKKLILA